ncbi:hypothetical protein BELL_0247g00090 [Botrytis elliptica]|uniref:Uncharacterized protein n=1 Tax=Botrytis elliptica TaxID=278938 RepID=A0A4Z1JNM1_9HELO|nr:hypothetical protein EAE99_004735 [Botrytis elliptica]TGO74924.1 hypothetical protein BELL_0247g00090 [Botrytis elliptica]
MSDWETASGISSLSSDSAEHNELLKLLRGINEKLSRDLDIQLRVNASTPNQPSANRSDPVRSDIWRWYENTYSGPKMALSIELPPSRPTSSIEGRTSQHNKIESIENDINSYECLDKVSVGLRSWCHPYSATPLDDSDTLKFCTEILTDCLGVALHIPSDDRIGLPFTIQGIHEHFERKKYNFEPLGLDGMNQFLSLQEATKLSECNMTRSSVQFLIVDYDPWTERSYSFDVLGCLSEANKDTSSIESSRSVESHSGYLDFFSLSEQILTFDPLILPQLGSFKTPARSFKTPARSFKTPAPWRRLILLNGMANTGHWNYSNKHTNGHPATVTAQAPADNFLSNKVAQELFNSHLASQFPRFSPNQVHNSSHYTLTFFELVNGCDVPLKAISRWKTGPFFGDNPKSAHRHLRLSTLTVSIFTSNDYINTLDFAHGPFDPFYTILILGADEFFIRRKSKYILTHDTAIHAELECVELALSFVIERWKGLNVPFRELLEENFLDIEQYSNLLFDDEKFTRSRKYFWAIGCLTEIDNVLSDNIKQWELYYKEHLQPLLDDEDTKHLLDAACLYPPRERQSFRGDYMLQRLKKTIQQAQTHVNALKELRSGFSRKLETTKALRDGCTGGEQGVHEARRKRQTFEALWAIPNIQESSTKVPFIITAYIVGAITYAIVLNMDFISQKIDANYDPQRHKLVDHMQKDNSEWWQETGKRFEVFKPTSESKVPTEWCIPIYLIRKIFKRGSCTKKASREAENSSFACSDSDCCSQYGSIERNYKRSKFKNVFARLRWSRKSGDAPV